MCDSLSNRCSQEALDVNGILINDSYFHCSKAAGYLKKPHRESCSHRRESSALVSCPTPHVSYKFVVSVRCYSHGVYVYITKMSSSSAKRRTSSPRRNPCSSGEPTGMNGGQSGVCSWAMTAARHPERSLWPGTSGFRGSFRRPPSGFLGRGVV